MKLNKIMLGVSGVMALALTACHDDPTYTPAPATTTPPAYFSISDETEIDLEDTDTQFVVPVYRADGTGEATCNVTTTVTFDAAKMDNICQNCTAKIEVQAHAVQVANNGDTVLDATGWPA